jgi:hypothetical protein
MYTFALLDAWLTLHALTGRGRVQFPRLPTSYKPACEVDLLLLAVDLVSGHGACRRSD